MYRFGMGCKPPLTILIAEFFRILGGEISLSLSLLNFSGNNKNCFQLFRPQGRKAGFGEGTPQQVSREGQNRRIADFGTVVETCSKTATDCPCPGFSVHRTDKAGLAARCGRSFFLSPILLRKGALLPAGRGFSQNFFCFCNAEKRILATGGAGNFLLALYYGQKSKMPNARAENFPLTYYYNLKGSKWPKTEPGKQKAANLFQDLLLSLAAGGRQVFSFESSGQVAPMMEVQKFTDLFFNKFTCQLVNLPYFF